MRLKPLSTTVLARGKRLGSMAGLLLAATFAGTLAHAQPPQAAQPAQTAQPFFSGAASRCTGNQIQCPGSAGGVPIGDYNLSLRSKADQDLPNPYERNETWLKIPAAQGKLGATSAIDVDRDGKSIWIARRCEVNGCTGSNVDPVMKFDANGNFVRSFGAGMLVYPHGLWVDQQGNVWVSDTTSNMTVRGQPAPAGTVPNGNQVLKFSPEGKLLLKLGTPGVYGQDETHFNQPSDVVTNANGDVFVADGHELTNMQPRIVKYDKTGKFIKAWALCTDGKPNAPIGEILSSDCSHGLAMDSQGRIFVADRGNGRIVIYNQDGQKLDEWKNWGRPSGIHIDAKDVVYAADSTSSVTGGNAYIRGVHVGDAKTGKITAFIPDVLGNPTPWFPLRGTTGPEGVTADSAGNIYVSQVAPFGQVARYTPIPK